MSPYLGPTDEEDDDRLGVRTSGDWECRFTTQTITITHGPSGYHFECANLWSSFRDRLAELFYHVGLHSRPLVNPWDLAGKLLPDSRQHLAAMIAKTMRCHPHIIPLSARLQEMVDAELVDMGEKALLENIG